MLDTLPDLVKQKFGPLQWTALHFAADAACGSQILKLLVIQARADVEAEDANGRTPIQVARNERTKSLLIRLGAKWKE